MHLHRSTALSFFSFAVLTFATPAGAAERAMNLTPNSMAVSGAASISSTVNLPATDIGQLFIQFVMPPDYEPNTPVKVRLYMQQPTAGTCNGLFRVANAVRRRGGKIGYSTSFPNIDRVVPSNGSELAQFSATAGTILVKTWLVQTPQALARPFSGTAVGDGISIRIDRLPADAQDTCTGFIFVTHAEVRYKVAAAAP